MSVEAYAKETLSMEYEIYSFENFSNRSSSFHEVCTFNEVTSLTDIVDLFRDDYCRRHSVGFTVFLCVVNFLILVCGFFGNSMVIYVVAWKIKKKTASSLFILNLAVADLLVILCCIPATLVANIFIPWIFGDTICKVVAYAQGVSVFCSVYSLVAISFDRFRAIHQSFGLSPHLSIAQAIKIILVIWVFGVTVTLPWAFVFKLVHLNPDDSKSNNFLPFCHEIWDKKYHEIIYFLLIHVFACFLLPLGLILACNMEIWRSVLGVCQNSSVNPSTSYCVNIMTEMHRKRKLRVLKLFTFLTVVFFICWLPLYLIMARVKFFYNDNFSGTPCEKKLIVILIPIAQLLGTCNSCVNPILYALLNQKFRESFKSVFACSCFCNLTSPTTSVASRGNNSIVAVDASKLGFRDTPV